ncbi:MAG: 6-bladed beta-propeller [Dissulfurispiraceae bacterium]|jgi:DNA-binding beta-propeller fold protein YncE
MDRTRRNDTALFTKAFYLCLETALFALLTVFCINPGIAFADTYQYVTQWGGYGTGNGQFYYPAGIAADNSGNIYVADMYNYRIQSFNSSGTYISQWGGYGTGNGQFYYPSGVAVDNSGNVYVADTYNNRIQKFNSSDAYVSQWGSYGTGNGQFNQTRNIGVDGSSNVYVVDLYNNRIQKFDSYGTYITQWGTTGTSNGQFSYPSGVAVDSSGYVYVSDSGNNHIEKFSSGGTYITQWGSSGTGNGQFNNPWGVAVDSSGNVYVADYNNNRVQKFSSSGAYITQWGSSGTGNGQFNGPMGVAVDNSGNVYVVEFSNNRVQKFSLSGTTTSYSIIASAGTGGSISPSGTTTVSSGGSQTYTITASSGYSISSVLVDGSSVGAVSTYPFSNVTANHTISVTFSAISTYSISGTVNTAGRAAISGVTVALSGTATGTTTTDSKGNYSFTGLYAGSYTITPSLSGYTFTPATIGLSVSSGSATNENFSGTLISCTNSPAMLARSTPLYYSSLQAAFNEAASGDTIMSEGLTFTENPTFSQNIPVILQGGYDCNYSGSSSYSTVSGSLTITNGKLTVSNFIIRSAPTANCTYSLSPISTFGSAGGTATLNIAGSCSGSWQAASDSGWINFGSTCDTGICTSSTISGTGSGSAGFYIDSNYTGSARTGHVTVSGQSFAITENATAYCTSCGVSYADVSSSYYARQYILGVGCAGIIPGCGGANYCPDSYVTNDAMAAYVVRAKEGEPPSDYCSSGSGFSDVDSTSTSCPYIKRLYDLGITQGCGSGNFCPGSNVTNDVMAAYIVRALEGEPPADYCSTGSPFNDVAISYAYCPHIKRLYELQISTGCGSGNFCPSAVVTKGQMAELIYLAFLKGQCDGTAQSIGSNGGTVTSNGATVTVPAGAFSTPSSVVLTKVSDPTETDQISSVYEISGIPANFSQDITIQIPVSGSLSGNVYAGLYQDMYFFSLGTPDINSTTYYPAQQNGGYISFTLPASAGLPSSARMKVPAGSGPAPGNTISISASDGWADPLTSSRGYFQLSYENKFGCSTSVLNQWLQYAENNYTLLTTTLGFSVAGLKNPFPMTVSNMTQPGKEPPYALTGFGQYSRWLGKYYGLSIDLNKDFCNSSTTSDLNNMNITLGHEFFHAIQYTYDPAWSVSTAAEWTPYTWFYESSSIWLESKIVPDYVDILFTNNASFYTTGLEAGGNCDHLCAQNHGYGASGFLRYLTNKYGDGLVLNIWNNIKSGNSTHTVDAIKATGRVNGGVVSLSDDWSAFVQQFITGTTGFAGWSAPSNDALYGAGATAQTFSWTSYPLSAYHVNLRFTKITSEANYKISMSIAGGNTSADLTGVLYKGTTYVGSLGVSSFGVDSGYTLQASPNDVYDLIIINKDTNADPLTGYANVNITITPPQLSISSLYPASGSVGDQVTITGSGFGTTQGGSTVSFNGTAATTVYSWSDTQIVVAVPSGATTGNVVATVNGAQSNGVPFTVTTLGSCGLNTIPTSLSVLQKLTNISSSFSSYQTNPTYGGSQTQCGSVEIGSAGFIDPLSNFSCGGSVHLDGTTFTYTQTTTNGYYPIDNATCSISGTISEDGSMIVSATVDYNETFSSGPGTLPAYSYHGTNSVHYTIQNICLLGPVSDIGAVYQGSAANNISDISYSISNGGSYVISYQSMDFSDTNCPPNIRLTFSP